MKNGIAAGAVAGLAGAIVGIIFLPVGAMMGLYPEMPASMEVAVGMIVLTIIWGAVFGAMYQRFYNQIPGEGITKGLVFGYGVIWLIKDVMGGSYLILGGNIVPAIVLIFDGIFVVAALGSVLGALYKK